MIFLFLILVVIFYPLRTLFYTAAFYLYFKFLRYSKIDAFLLLVNTSYHAPFVEFLPQKASNVSSRHRGSMSPGIQLTLKYFREEKVNEKEN